MRNNQGGLSGTPTAAFQNFGEFPRSVSKLQTNQQLYEDKIPSNNNGLINKNVILSSNPHALSQ